MGRQLTVKNDILIEKLDVVFRNYGFKATSLTELSKVTGLKKASLYHRFPDGKNQMAMEVLTAARDRMIQHVLAALREEGSYHARVKLMAERLNDFYSSGKQGCFLNILSSNDVQQEALSNEVKSILSIFINEIQTFLENVGYDKNKAKARAQRFVMLLQGSLVLCRGMKSSEPFLDFIENTPDELFD